MLHQHPTTTSRKPAALTGELIDSAYALQLKQGFRERFPQEITSIFIKTATVFDAVKELPQVSGIRFMYGMESANDPTSKVILLIPCNSTSAHLAIPNTIVQPQGYLNHRGERVDLKRTWELLYNHAVHYACLLPEVKFNKIVRGVFFGIDSLHALLKEYTQAHGMHYYFGWDETVAGPAIQHKPVLQPVQADGNSYNIYMDYGSPCPPVCPGEGDSCVATNSVNIGHVLTNDEDAELNIYRHYRDNYFLANAGNGPLVEMYYYVSPALTEAIQDTGRASAIYTELYNEEIRQCNVLIGEGKYEAAKVLFEQTMERLMKTYLFH
ncbi:MAG: hypothetical protein J7621_22885 [Niastella sp.]|nr:hypothetical protein [Niastella sp.]